MEHKNIITRWILAKTRLTNELSRLGQAYNMIAEDVKESCGQCVPWITWEAGEDTYTISMCGQWMAMSAHGETEIRIFSDGLGTKATDHWSIPITVVERQIDHLKTVTTAKLRSMCEEKMAEDTQIRY